MREGGGGPIAVLGARPGRPGLGARLGAMTNNTELSPDARPPEGAAPEAPCEDADAVRRSLRSGFETVRGAARIAVVLGVALLIAGLDQLTKWLVQNHVPLGPKSLPVIGGVLWLSHVYNEGIAWGMFDEHPEIVSAIALGTSVFVLLVGLFGRFGWRSYIAGLGLILGGAAGNLIDRVLRAEGVLDFIDVGWWPQFNVADTAVCVGAALVGRAVIRATNIADAAVRRFERARADIAAREAAAATTAEHD